MPSLLNIVHHQQTNLAHLDINPHTNAETEGTACSSRGRVPILIRRWGVMDEIKREFEHRLIIHPHLRSVFKEDEVVAQIALRSMCVQRSAKLPTCAHISWDIPMVNTFIQCLQRYTLVRITYTCRALFSSSRPFGTPIMRDRASRGSAHRCFSKRSSSRTNICRLIFLRRRIMVPQSVVPVADCRIYPYTQSAEPRITFCATHLVRSQGKTGHTVDRLYGWQ